MSNPNREVFKYHGRCTAERYNQFFNPNICHVCKSVNEGDFILCDKCCLISYCSDMHKRAHHVEHAKICAIIAEVLKEKSQTDTHKYSDWQQWIQSRKKLMELIQQRFNEPTKPYMQQMILWSKSCIVCHQQDKLRVCERCFSANYCDEHAEVFGKIHSVDKCEELIRLLNIDIETISGKTTNVSYSFLLIVNSFNYGEQMLEFCIEHMITPREHINWLAKDYVQSDHLSGPLTLYSGLKRTDSLHLFHEKSVVIHIVTNTTKKIDPSAWEILLHLAVEINNLSIIIIGQKLKYEVKSHQLCSLCRHEKKEFVFCSYPMPHYGCVRLLMQSLIPTIIVGFDIEFNDKKMWSESLKSIQRLHKPLLLTCSSKEKAQCNVIKIQEALCNNVEPIFSEKNYFSGLAPHRDLETGGIYFCNEYLIIYKFLHVHDTSSDKMDDS